MRQGRSSGSGRSDWHRWKGSHYGLCSFCIHQLPAHQHNEPGFIGIAAADTLANHVLPLIGHRADDQHIPQSLERQIACGIVPDSGLAELLVL